MTETHLMIGITVVVVGAAMAVLTWPRLRRKLPRTAFEGFGSRAALLGHFRASFSLLYRKRWLLYFPLGALVFIYAVCHAPILWRRRSELAARGALARVQAQWSLQPCRISGRVVLWTFVGGSKALMAGYAGVCTRVPIVSLVVVMLGFLVSVGRLRRHTAEANLGRLRLAARVVLAVFLCLVPLGVAQALAWHAGWDTVSYSSGSRAKLSVLVGLHYLAALGLSFAGFFLLALLDGCFLVYVRRQLTGEAPQFGRVWNGALAVLMPLVKLNVLWFVVFELPQVIVSLWGWLALDGGAWAWAFHRVAEAPLQWWGRLGGPVALTFCCAKFFIVVNGEQTAAALRANLVWIGRHLCKWFVFVGLCVVVITLLRLSDYVVPLHWLATPLGWGNLFLQLLGACADAIVTVAVLIALFGFFLRYGSQEDVDRERGDSQVQSRERA